MANEKKAEKTDDLKDSRNESENASKEALEEMRRRSENKTDTPTAVRESSLPDLQLTDNQPKSTDGSVISREDQPDGTMRMKIANSDGRSSEFVYDSSGTLNCYRDFNGRTYNRQEDGSFRDFSNPVQKQGVDLEVDRDTGTVLMKDRSTQITKTITANGVETTDYANVGGGKTTSKMEGGSEYITIESINRPVRTLVIDKTDTGSRVREYTDSQGTTYKFTGEMEEVVDEKDPSNKRMVPKYEAIDKDGKTLGRNFRVTADRSGNVVTRNEDNKDQPTYARRELNNGTIITSGVDKDSRVITDSNNNVLTNGSPEAEKALESKVIQEVPPNVNLQKDVEEAQNADGYVLSGSKFFWFRDKVKTGGDWDYKSPRSGDNVNNIQYEDYGNWHYGYIGTATGISSNFLEQQAGVEQQKQGTSKTNWGNPSSPYGLNPFGGSGTYGDDPRDNAMIKDGVQDRKVAQAEEYKDGGVWSLFDSKYLVA